MIERLIGDVAADLGSSGLADLILETPRSGTTTVRGLVAPHGLDASSRKGAAS